MSQPPDPACFKKKLITQTKNLKPNQDFKPRRYFSKALNPIHVCRKDQNQISHIQQLQNQNQNRNHSTTTTMALASFISTLWTSLSHPSAPSRRRRRTVTIDPDSIEPINHWFPGLRNKKQPRRLVETPTAGHWPEYRVAKKGVGKGRKRCGECGALVKEVAKPGKRVGGVGGKKKNAGRKGKKEVGDGGGRRLRGRVVEYVGL